MRSLGEDGNVDVGYDVIICSISPMMFGSKRFLSCLPQGGKITKTKNIKNRRQRQNHKTKQQ